MGASSSALESGGGKEGTRTFFISRARELRARAAGGQRDEKSLGRMPCRRRSPTRPFRIERPALGGGALVVLFFVVLFPGGRVGAFTATERASHARGVAANVTTRGRWARADAAVVNVLTNDRAAARAGGTRADTQRPLARRMPRRGACRRGPCELAQ